MTRIGAKAKKRQSAPADDNTARSSGQTLDLNRWTVENILPGAVELCEEGQRRETALHRDPQRFQRRVIDYVDTVVWSDHGNGVAVPMRMLETCEEQTVIPRMDRQPVNIPILRAVSEAQLHWALFSLALRSRMFGMGKEANEKARKFATSVSFRHIGSKESSVIRPGVIHG